MARDDLRIFQDAATASQGADPFGQQSRLASVLDCTWLAGWLARKLLPGGKQSGDDHGGVCALADQSAAQGARTPLLRRPTARGPARGDGGVNALQCV